MITYKDTYFCMGGNIHHPTQNNTRLPNRNMILQTYLPGTNIRIPPYSEFGIDRSSQQNDADPVTGERRYFFPPFVLVTEEN